MTPTPDIRAFIFDLDGVITDTAEFHYLSWKRLADEVGVPFTRADNDHLRGLSRRASLNRILNGRPIDEATAEEWMARKNSYYLAYLETITPANVLPGAIDLLDDAHAQGIRVALASASRNARPVLDRLGITARFDVIGDGHCVVNTKPAPDIFIWVAGRLDVHPQQAVVFEDAEAGIDAALHGGFWAVGLGAAKVGHAHIQLDSLVDVSASAVIGRLGQRGG